MRMTLWATIDLSRLSAGGGVCADTAVTEAIKAQPKAAARNAVPNPQLTDMTAPPLLIAAERQGFRLQNSDFTRCCAGGKAGGHSFFGHSRPAGANFAPARVRSSPNAADRKQAAPVPATPRVTTRTSKPASGPAPSHGAPSGYAA